MKELENFPWDMHKPFLPQGYIYAILWCSIWAMKLAPRAAKALRNLWDHGYFAE